MVMYLLNHCSGRGLGDFDVFQLLSLKRSIMATKKTVTAQVGQAERTQVYEVGFHLVPSLPEEKLAGEFATIKDVIEKNGGMFISDDFPKLIPLAYEMTKVVEARHDKFTKAYFGWIKFDLDPAMIKNVKEALDASPVILRYLIIKTVRENTLIGNMLKIREKSAEIAADKKIETAEALPVNEAEIDKQIDSLVTEIK